MDSTDPEDTSPDSSISSPKRTKPESPSYKSPNYRPVPSPPQRSSSVDILREMSIDVGDNPYTTQSDGEEALTPAVVNGNSVSADAFSLGSSVFSDTVYFTPEEHGNLSSKRNLKRNQIPREDIHTKLTSDSEFTEIRAGSLGTFKSPYSNDHSKEKPKESEISGTFGAIGTNRNTVSLKEQEKKHSSDNNKNGHSQIVSKRDKSWQDSTAVEDYSMEMLRRENYYSVNPNTIEYSIVDDKSVNDTNNNLDSDLFDGVERDKVYVCRKSEFCLVSGERY